MKTFVHEGKRISYTNTSTALSSGDVVVLGSNRIGVCVADIEATSGVGEVSVAGVHVLDATVADDWSSGAILYWNSTTSKLSDTAGTIIAGRADGDKAVGATTANVRLADNVISSTVTDTVTCGAVAGSVQSQHSADPGLQLCLDGAQPGLGGQPWKAVPS